MRLPRSSKIRPVRIAGEPLSRTSAGNRTGGALRLHRLEQVAVENRLVLSAMGLAPIDHLSNVEPVFEQMGQRAHAKADAAASATICEAVGLGPHSQPIKVLNQRSDRAKFEIAPEDRT